MSGRPAIELGGGLRFDPPLLLAPMEGVTDRSFRGLVAEANPGAVGALCTEFVRVTAPPIPVRRLRAELVRPGPPGGPPLGLQLMGNRPETVAATAAGAAEAGADFVDLNFGCPAPRVFQHRAGSALLDDPPALERMVRAVVAACPLPVTVKIRAGGAEDRRIEEIVRRIEDAGARLVTVHARLRIERYTDPPDWRRIERAVAAVSIPVVGNGGVDSPAAVGRMFAATGCAGVMIGRAILADPWLFRRALGRPAPTDAAAQVAWLRCYAARMQEGGATPLQAAGRLKQIVKALVAAGRIHPAEAAHPLLRMAEPDAILERLGRILTGHGSGASLS
ncbi:MAG: tRNA-dihydrouridine synthase family protein [Planctomycetota bacterium]|nr:MAG: tRNA-dihydrouridine synthase family protein [Planctomycetota bacterium]